MIHAWDGLREPAERHVASRFLRVGEKEMGEDKVGAKDRSGEGVNGPWSQMDGGMDEEEETQSDKDGGRRCYA